MSVIIPCFNGAGVVAQTLDSVLAQSWPRLEVILVDDGSTDATPAAVQPYRDRIVYVRQENQGLAAARNAGMARATGELVAWLDSDDLWSPEKVAVQVAVLRRHPECVLVATNFSAFDGEGWVDPSHARTYFGAIGRAAGGLDGLFPRREALELREVPHLGPGAPDRVAVHWGDVYRRLVMGNFLLPSTVLFRRDVAARVGPLDPTLRRDTDSDYLLRVSAEGAVAFVDHALMRYRYSPGQMSSDRHLADIALSRLLLLDRLKARDPSLLADGDFRRRLGYSHLAAASAMASDRRLAGAEHLVRSLGYGYADAVTLRTVAKLLLPRAVARALRKAAPASPG